MKILVFGEILWDVFGEKKEIGGAPFNFASHMAKLGADVYMVSALGRDPLGVKAKEYIKEFGICGDYVADLEAPTGYCKVTLKDGAPNYDLVRGVAYDQIPYVKPHMKFEGFYFGTLAQRGEISRQTLQNLLKENYREVFFDINIRQKYYSAEMIEESLKKTTIFKISREEIGVLGISGTNEEICQVISEKYPELKLIIVTLDKDGAMVYDCGRKEFFYSPKHQVEVVSTVGAGDSFSACFFVNYLSGQSIPDCLSRSVELSTYVVTQLGAIPEYSDGLIERISPEK